MRIEFSLTINQLNKLNTICNFNEDESEMCEVTLIYDTTGVEGPGVYAYLTDYPEEGTFFLGEE